MARYALALALLIGLGPRGAAGRAFEVKLLDGTERSGVWGTEEYRIRVTDQGALRDLMVHGKQVMRYAGALYTSPFPASGSKSIRTVQGEGAGERGLTVEPPERRTCERRGVRVFRFRHQVAKPAVFEGQTLCEVDQAVTLTPTGEITVAYDCRWVRTCRWRGFSVLMFFTSDTVAGCEYMGLRGDRVFTGRLLSDAAAAADARLREPLEQLTLRTRAGPVHFVWDTPLPTSLSWFKQMQLQMRPAGVARKGTIYKGTTGRIAYRVLLPVSQQ